MGERLEVVSSKMVEFRCPKCAATLNAIDAVGDTSIECDELNVLIELRCPSCHATVGNLQLDGPAPENENEDEDEDYD